MGTAWTYPQAKSSPSVARSQTRSMETLLKQLAWRPTRVFLAALTKCLDFGKNFLYSIQVAGTWRKVEEGETEEGQFIFSCSGKKQEKERDSFVFVQIKEKEELRENKFVRRKLLVLNVSSVIGLLCTYCLSAFLALFCGSEPSVRQNALQSYIFSPCVFAAYYEI